MPALIPAKPSRKIGWRKFLLLLLVAGGAAGIAAKLWLSRPAPLPAGIAQGNGRLEADEVDIDTKFAGRVARLMVDEGDQVAAGAILAVMDTRDLAAQLQQYQQIVEQAQQQLRQVRENAVQQDAVVKFAHQQVARTRILVPRGYATMETLDQQTQALNSAIATREADEAAIGAAQHALDAATHQVDYYQVEIADNTLVAPKTGPIEYRVANIGEVLPAGGKVFTMLDADYVYMDIYLPTRQAGRIRIGAPARIVLDAYPRRVIPAKVVFLASQAQFTPKMVETSDERDKLMFRVRVRIDPARLQGHESRVRSGLPGVAYVRIDDATPWPASLAPSPALPAAQPASGAPLHSP